MTILIDNMGGKGVDFGQITSLDNIPSGLIFLEDKVPGGFCLYDPFKFFSVDEAKAMLYQLVSNLKNSS